MRKGGEREGRGGEGRRGEGMRTGEKEGEKERGGEERGGEERRGKEREGERMGSKVNGVDVLPEALQGALPYQFAKYFHLSPHTNVKHSISVVYDLHTHAECPLVGSSLIEHTLEH